MLVKPHEHLLPIRDQRTWEVRVAPLELQGIRPSEQVRAAAIARLYYLEGKSKSEIAEEFGISRFKVARVLDQALESGLVRIEIRPPAGIDDSLSEQVRKRFGLRHVLVVAADGSDEIELRSSLAHTATALLSEIVTEDDVVGIGYGRTLTIMAQTMNALARCPIVQLTGALLGVNRDENSVELVRQISGRNGGPAYPMYTPQVLPDAATAATLRKQPEVAETYRQFDKVTKAVVAVGSWNPPSSQLYDSLPEDERKALLKRGVAAEVCATLLDRQGKTVVPEFSDRCISISGDQLRAIEDVIAVAGGPNKVAALRSVILSGHAKSVITDTTLAQALLETP
jgi:DNA-binding transcriptional regulator LsrR (DeoR family)